MENSRLYEHKLIQVRGSCWFTIILSSFTKRVIRFYNTVTYWLEVAVCNVYESTFSDGLKAPDYDLVITTFAHAAVVLFCFFTNFLDNRDYVPFKDIQIS